MPRALQLLLFYLALLWLGAMLLLGNLALLPLLLLPRSLCRAPVQRLISATFRLFLRGATAFGLLQLDLTGLDRLNQTAVPEQGLLLVANHPSMIDVLLVISRVRNAVCMMKASLGANAFLAVGAHLAGYVSTRHTDRMIRQAARVVASGAVLLAFPEGTRTVRQPLNPLKPGIALIARRSGAPLQTILIRTNSPYLGKDWPIWRAPRFPLVYQARLGECIAVTCSVDETMVRLQRYFERELPSSIDPGLTV
ncbi:MAG: hypothetical protein OJF60_000210 [Burkholderiaceae bacterium]|jgi:1-acyl-sn-glycerol-3-phosphate acyltransferase|nr:MAG: hypothetical protein OJF60_000210 [Burkholderiaceae bacterium]